MIHSIVLDPTAERAPAQRARLARPASLEGKVVGIDRFGISAPGNVVMDELGINAAGIVKALS